jgi:hypothetical protein
MSEYNRPLRWTISRLPFCSPTSFFSPKGRYPELFNLKDSLKHRAHPTTTPESPKDVRPPSTKSRNEVRLDMQSSRSLLWYLKIRATHAKSLWSAAAPIWKQVSTTLSLYHTKLYPRVPIRHLHRKAFSYRLAPRAQFMYLDYDIVSLSFV